MRPMAAIFSLRRISSPRRWISVRSWKAMMYPKSRPSLPINGETLNPKNRFSPSGIVTQNSWRNGRRSFSGSTLCIFNHNSSPITDWTGVSSTSELFFSVISSAALLKTVMVPPKLVVMRPLRMQLTILSLSFSRCFTESVLASSCSLTA